MTDTATATPQPVRLGQAARRRCPTVLQLDPAECGAAALAMVLAHHGLWLPLEELRVACGVSRDGSTAINLVRAARRLGMTAQGWRLEPEQVAEKSLPAIAFWEFNHFVVIEGIGRHTVFLNDPATGPRRVSHEDFVESFTGVLLTFTPTAEFRPEGTRPNPWRALAARLDHARNAVAFLVLLGLFLIVPGLIVPAFTKVFVDDVLARDLGGWLKPLLLGMALTALVRAAITWLQEHHLARLQLKLDVAISSRLIWHLLRLPIPFFTQRFAGDIAARFDAGERLARTLSGQLSATALSLVSITFFAIAMALYDLPLTLVGIALTLLNIVPLQLVMRYRADGYTRMRADEARLLGTSISGVQMIETLKATGREVDFFTRWAGWQARVANGRRKLAYLTGLLNAATQLLTGLTTAAVLGYGSLRAMNGHLTVGALVAFQSLLASFARPIESLVRVVDQLEELKGDLNLVDEVMRHRTDPAAVAGTAACDPGGGGASKLAGAIAFRNVTFGYSPLAPPLVKDFSLSVVPGGWVAVVGRSGSGKSTLARLAVGLAQPWSGEVLLDGRQEAAWPRGLVASSRAFVSQEIVLFEGSMRDNLTLWDTTVAEADLVAAAQDAAVSDVIAARPGGYDAALEEGGRNLSGGQAQRLEIARALVPRPTLLVLDEATSALDPVTESRVLAALRRRGATVLMVAHRLSAIRDCDEIIVLEHGKVVQRGSHAELSARPGPYLELIRAE
ncbi:MAG: NHLP family bacteriocin export ABC transporter peptidase/permease/ATPase subunit [Azospirillum sp.]|nr:NHLP family bacteriocin export ABC transporter peptidase/permease/ATPase subunit [Azospirillum sp.]